MRSVTALPDFLRAGVFFQVAIFMAISLTRRYVISSSSIRVTLFMMLLISAFLSPVQAGDQDMSFIESTLRILTSLSAFLISESPSIVILILTDKSVISIIQPRIARVIVHRSSSLVIGLDSNVNETQGTDHRSSLELLPRQIIGEIAQRMGKDFTAFAGFCQECRSVCKEIASFQLPWLMLSEKPDTDIRHIFDLCDGNRYPLQLSTVDGKRCWGSPHGWVVVLGPDYETHLVHLKTGNSIPLPPLDTIRREVADREEYWFRLVHKFILFKNVLDHDQLSFLVMAIFGPMNSLAFARVASDRGGAALNGRGQGDEWIIVDNPNNWKFKDVARFQGRLYGFCDNGTLVRFELDPRLSAGVQFIASQPPEQDVGEPQKLYLVESLENLYGVFRYGYHVPSEKRHVTISFLVYKFNFNAFTWEEVTDLEDHAVFVGDGNSWCIPTSTINNKSNSIYFVDDNWEWQMYPGVAYGGRDLGVFDMARRVIQSLPFGKDNPRFHSRPNWITLSPKYT